MGDQKFIEEQKKVAQFIRDMEEELKVLQKSQRAAGWMQRNAAISHVYSDYRQQEKVLEKRKKWESITFHCNALKGILVLLLPHRDIYGFYDISGMKKELKELLKLAEKKDEFEIAELINQYKFRFFEVCH